MRAFYAIAAAAWDGAALLNAVELSRADGVVRVLSAIDPHPDLEALGATRLGATLADLAPDDAAAVTSTLVARTTADPDAPGGERTDWLQVPTVDVQPTDEVLGEAPVPLVVFAGDDPTAYA